jgi:hypothetical protein
VKLGRHLLHHGITVVRLKLLLITCADLFGGSHFGVKGLYAVDVQQMRVYGYVSVLSATIEVVAKVCVDLSSTSRSGGATSFLIEDNEAIT